MPNPKPPEKFEVEIENFLGGFCPAYWKNNYPSFGSRNMAAKMKNIDLTDPAVLKPGPGVQTLTNGDQAGAVNSLIKSIMQTVVADDETFGVGGTALYKIKSAIVTSDADFPHKIGGAAAKTGEDVKEYNDDIYYTYNHAATNGEMGKLVLPNTFDDDFLSTAPAIGAFSLQPDVPHPLEVGGDDIIYIGNKNYVSTYDKSTDTAKEKAIDLPADCVVVDLKFYLKKLYITVNWPDITGDNRVMQSIFIWNTVDDSWDNEIPQIKKGGGMLKKGGVLFIFYEDLTSEGEGRLGYLDGVQIKEVCQFDGSLPAFNQISEAEGFILWISDGLVFAWGGGEERRVPVRLFQYMQAKHATIGGISVPFGKILLASEDGGGNYDLSKEHGYQTDSYWKTLLFPISGKKGRMGVIERMVMDIDPLSSGARIDIALKNNKGTTVFEGEFSYASDTEATKKFFDMVKKSENMRIECDWSKSSATTSFDIKRMYVEGHILD